MWSVGCIICELLGRKPIFKGKDHFTQLTAITQVLGTPAKELIVRIASLYAWDYFAASVQYPKIPFGDLYPAANAGALDLIEHLLVFDPGARPSAVDCLEHPYFGFIRSPDDEPVSKEYFDFSFERLGSAELEMALREEVKSFRKEVRNEPYTPTTYARAATKRAGASPARSSYTQSHHMNYQPRPQYSKY